MIHAVSFDKEGGIVSVLATVFINLLYARDVDMINRTEMLRCLHGTE
jgi:hypothetical protein